MKRDFFIKRLWRFLSVIITATLFLSGCGGGGGGDIIPPFTLNDAVALGDMNGDGRADMAVANTSSNDVSVLLQDPASPGTFLPAVNYTCGSYANSVAIGDLNNDGRLDMAVSVTGGVALLFQDQAKPGTFLPAISYSTADGTSAVAIGDLDGDGRRDFVAAGAGNLYVFMQDTISPGTFQLDTIYPEGPRASSVAIQDIDGDDLPDLVTVNAGLSDGGGNSRISIRIQDPAQRGNFLPAVYYPAANGSRAVAVGDLNGDGRPDLAVASVVYSSQSPGVVQVFLQNPGVPGTFLASRSYSAGYTPQSIAIGDLNGDGKPDLASNDGPVVLFQDPTQPGIFFNPTIP